MRAFLALIHKDAGSDYGVSFPDVPGCITAAPTLDDARDLAAEALALHVNGMIEDGQAVPEPSTLDAVMADRGHRDGVAILVPLIPDAAGVMRVDVTLPADVLERIDRHAAERGLDRSAVLTRAAREMMDAGLV